nr:reverse transcriptase domain-containing protein [Tanacetum cinerariifolium]
MSTKSVVFNQEREAYRLARFSFSLAYGLRRLDLGLSKHSNNSGQAVLNKDDIAQDVDDLSTEIGKLSLQQGQSKREGNPSRKTAVLEPKAIERERRRQKAIESNRPSFLSQVTQIDTFYNGLALSHWDIINTAAGGTFMQKTSKECYELIENMTAHHNPWDTSAIRDEISRNISSTSTTESPEVVRKLEMMNKNFLEMMRQFQTVKNVDTKCKTCSGHHSFTECPSVGGYTQETTYATTGNYNSGGLLNNKEKLFDLAMTPMNENCSAVILKKLPEKLEDPNKFLIPRDFLELDECLALTDLGASINWMPLSIWRKLSLPELTPIQMILEFADRSMTRPAGIAEDVFVKVGKLHFLTDFVVVDYIVDPCILLILGRPFLRTGQALIYVYGEDLILRVDDEAITFKVGQTSKYSYNDAESINRIDVIDVACEEYVQEVLGFFDNSKSDSHTLTSDPIISSSSPSFTPFERSDFILEEIETFLRTPNELSNLDNDYYDTKGDILYLECLLNEDPSLNLPPMKTEYHKQVDAIMTKPSIEEPPELELK